jgi:hypothetical protein
VAELVVSTVRVIGDQCSEKPTLQALEPEALILRCPTMLLLSSSIVVRELELVAIAVYCS